MSASATNSPRCDRQAGPGPGGPGESLFISASVAEGRSCDDEEVRARHVGFFDVNASNFLIADVRVRPHIDDMENATDDGFDGTNHEARGSGSQLLRAAPREGRGRSCLRRQRSRTGGGPGSGTAGDLPSKRMTGTRTRQMIPSSPLVVGCSEQLPNEVRAYHLMGTSTEGAVLLSWHGATYSAVASEVCAYPELLERMLGLVLPGLPGEPPGARPAGADQPMEPRLGRRGGRHRRGRRERQRGVLPDRVRRSFHLAVRAFAAQD